MTTISLAAHRPVLAERIPASLVRDASLVVGVAALTAGAAQVSFYLPGTAVPFTGQTFAVLLAAAAVGPLRAVFGQTLYILLGLVGLPIFAEGSHGAHVVFGATGGYLIGFVAASALIGWFARRGLDRNPLTLAISFLAASALVYLCGVPVLAHAYHMSASSAIHQGAVVFMIGDLIKAAIAAALLPTAWRLLR